MRLRENSRSANAVATFLPRMSCATRLSFCGLTRSMRATAFASFSPSARPRVFLPMFALNLAGRRRPQSVRRRRVLPGRGRPAGRGRRGAAARRGRGVARRAFRLAVRRVAIERPGRRELAEFVADHLLGHQHRNVLLAVVDAEGEPDELRQNGRAPAPDSDHLVAARRARRLRLLEQIAVDERTLPNRTRHDAVLVYLFRAWRLAMMNLVVDLFLRVFLPLVG